MYVIGTYIIIYIQTRDFAISIWNVAFLLDVQYCKTFFWPEVRINIFRYYRFCNHEYSYRHPIIVVKQISLHSLTFVAPMNPIYCTYVKKKYLQFRV